MPHSRSRRLHYYLCTLATLGLACLLLSADDASAATRKSRSKRAVARHASAALAKAAAAMSTPAGVQLLVDALRAELTIENDVTVEVVADNPLKASVAPIKGSDGAFRLSIDKAFLLRLNQADLRAVIAHELGHVWIYTHHPYLQTEQGANEIALLAVPRESIEKVYGKLWASGAEAGSLRRMPPVATSIMTSPKQ